MYLSLNCLIHGEVPEKLFTVEIETTKSVSFLRDLIKEKKASRLEHIDASDLDIWMVDLHLDELGADPVYVNLNTHRKLSPRTKLSTLFNHDECLHIIAKAPGTSH